MDLTTLLTGGGALTTIGIVVSAMYKDEIRKYFNSWVAYFKLGEYNLDGDKGTADWCEGCNAAAVWYVMKITAYRKPWLPGMGVVSTETLDDKGGRHRNDIPIQEWASKGGSRRHLSEEQKEAIKASGNDWPQK